MTRRTLLATSTSRWAYTTSRRRCATQLAGAIEPAKRRAEAGPEYILSEGIPPSSFSARVPICVFKDNFNTWVELHHQSSALLIAPVDQLLPDGEIDRMRRMVQKAAGSLSKQPPHFSHEPPFMSSSSSTVTSTHTCSLSTPSAPASEAAIKTTRLSLPRSLYE